MFLFQVYEVRLDFFHVLIESELSGDYLNMLNSSRVNPTNMLQPKRKRNMPVVFTTIVVVCDVVDNDAVCTSPAHVPNQQPTGGLQTTTDRTRGTTHRDSNTVTHLFPSVGLETLEQTRT